MDRARFSLVLEDFTTHLTICRSSMKIAALTFPDGVGIGGTLEARLRDRAQFVMAVEQELSRLVVDFAKHADAEDFPDGFKALWVREPAVEVANG